MSDDDECPICLEDAYSKDFCYQICCRKKIHYDCRATMVDDKCPLCRSHHIRNNDERLRLTIRDAERNYSSSQCSLGLHLFNLNKYEESFKWYKKAADQGNKAACYQVGACYVNGTGVKKSYDTAIKYFEIAANKNHVKSIYAIYKMLDAFDESNSQQYKYTLLKRASDLNYRPAVWDLAQHYLSTNNTLYNETIENAINIYKKYVRGAIYCYDATNITEMATCWKRIHEYEKKSIFLPINMFWYEKCFAFDLVKEHKSDLYNLYQQNRATISSRCAANNCSKTNNLGKCGVCYTYYCCVKCQREHWRDHKNHCNEVKKANNMYNVGWANR